MRSALTALPLSHSHSPHNSSYESRTSLSFTFSATQNQRKTQRERERERERDEERGEEGLTLPQCAASLLSPHLFLSPLPHTTPPLTAHSLSVRSPPPQRSKRQKCAEEKAETIGGVPRTVFPVPVHSLLLLSVALCSVQNGRHQNGRHCDCGMCADLHCFLLIL